MKQPVLRNTVIVIASCFLLAALIPVLLFSGADKQFFPDAFFVNIGFTGDSIFAFALVFFLLFFLDRKDLSFRLLAGLMFTVAFVQLCKNVFSGGTIQFYFENNVPEKSLVQNIISSHTAVAYTLCAFFVIHTKNVFLRILLITAACAAAYARIYFGGDTLVSVTAGLIPAAYALLLMHRSIPGEGTKRIFRKRRNTRISPQHMMPA